jgi:hypothetical protein
MITIPDAVLFIGNPADEMVDLIDYIGKSDA